MLKTVLELNGRAMTKEMAYLSEFGDDPTLIHPKDVSFVGTLIRRKSC